MVRIINLTLSLLLLFTPVYSQKTVLVKVSFFDYCQSSKNLYLAELKVNDTLKFKQYSSVNYFEFNVPIFLLYQGNYISINAERLSENEIEGTICLPFISSCECKHETRKIPVDSLLEKGEYSVKLAIVMQSVGCGHLPDIRFPFNSSNVDSAIIDFGFGDTLKLVEDDLTVYKLSEIIRVDKFKLIIGIADAKEKNAADLATKRAEEVRNYLIKYGVDKNQLTIKSEIMEEPNIYDDRQDANSRVYISY